MHRQPLLKLLARYQQRWPDEAAMVARVESLAQSHEDCFDRTCLPGHVTGSAWVLSHDRRRCLLVHHKKLSKWLQPGGHADGDPDVLRTARREVEEEAGLHDLIALPEGAAVEAFDVDVHPIPERRTPDGQVREAAHEHHDLRFLFAASSDEPLRISEESNEIGWFTPDEVHGRTQEESVLRLLDKCRPWMAS